jgi:hypothetical protein
MINKGNMLDVFEKYKYDQTVITKSKSWFTQQALLLHKDPMLKPGRVLQRSGTKVQTVKPGNLYMFFYDPKHKQTLPHYDTFPLVFPFEKTENGFLGLNMHYLSYKFRIVLLDNLLKFKSTDTIDETTRLRYSWNMLKGISRHRLVEPCVKHYLSDHIKTQIKLVSPTDWTTAMMLPVESFQKASANQVWKQNGVL